MAAIRHPSVVLFMGLCLNPVCVVTEFCARGSLSDVIRKAATSAIFAQLLDWPKRISMALDAAKVDSLHCCLAYSHSFVCHHHQALPSRVAAPAYVRITGVSPQHISLLAQQSGLAAEAMQHEH
jgi:hypothetical protein